MDDITITKKDFQHLNEVSRINKNGCNKNGEYKNANFRKEAKKQISLVKKKFKLIFERLKQDQTFNKDFKVNLSRIRGRTQQGGKPGKYYQNVWISLVDRKLYKKYSKKYQTAQVYLPQIQIGLDKWGLTTCELWLEKRALNLWGDKVLGYLRENPVKDTNIYFYVHPPGQYVNSSDDILTLISSRKLSGGFGIMKDKSEILQVTDIYSLIKRDSIKFIRKYYRPLMRWSINSEPTHRDGKLRVRKQSIIKVIKEISRKGSKETIIKPLHKQMQREYYKHLKKILGDDKVKTEENYIDIRVNQRGKVTIYELKTDKDPYRCIRSALGQLLFYAWRIKNLEGIKNIDLVAMGINEISDRKEIMEFYEYVNDVLNMNFQYEKYPFSLN